MSGPHSDKTPESAIAEDERDWSNMPVVAALPASLHPAEGGEDVLRRLAGATIVHIGAPETSSFEGGGLVLDYTLPGSTVQHRIIFAFTELGMWIEWDSLRDRDEFIITNRAMSRE
jgi:hypothetical protein